MMPEDNSTPASLNEQITLLAYQIYLERGCPEGADMDHWLEAERRIHESSTAAPLENKIVASIRST